MDRKGKICGPWFPISLVLQIELRRRGIVHAVFGTQIVAGLDEQMWLLSHQVDVAHGASRMSKEWRRPDEAGGALAEQINCLNRAQVVDGGELRQRHRLT